MPSWLTSQPFAITVAALLVIVFGRAQLTYWLARAVATGALRTRWSHHLAGPRVVRATATINTWGAPVVTLSFLTIGFQTVANAAAGLSRMPFGRYLLAMLPGCLAWALIYATVGLAAFQAAAALAARSPWGLAVIVVLLAAGIVALVLVRRRNRRNRAAAA